jgi:hypothetical protein
MVAGVTTGLTLRKYKPTRGVVEIRHVWVLASRNGFQSEFKILK